MKSEKALDVIEVARANDRPTHDPECCVFDSIPHRRACNCGLSALRDRSGLSWGFGSLGEEVADQ